MFRLLIVPIVIGILLSLFIYFLVPEIVSETDIVSYFAGTILDLSNAYFGAMPHVVASYIAKLNLIIVAITAGLLLTVIIQLLVLIADTFILLSKWIIRVLKRNRKKVDVKNLPSIDLESRLKGSTRGKNILGGGFDSIERD